jgi:hypothetical protein
VDVDPQVGDEVRVTWLDPAYQYEITVRELKRRLPPRKVVSYGRVVKVSLPWFWVAHELTGASELRGATVLSTSLVEEYSVLHVAEAEVPSEEGE